MKQTAYEWSLVYNVRPYNPIFWDDGDDGYIKFHLNLINETQFLEILSVTPHKVNSVPRKVEEFLELRMYGLVNYQLSGIQTGIQFQHAVTEYGEMVRYNPELLQQYIKWARDWKTSIILNGGKTNENKDRLGTMQINLKLLIDNGVPLSVFREPDLNDTITAIAFIVDERVFDTKLYPNFEKTPYSWEINHIPNEATLSKWESDNEENKVKWMEKIGGERNAFLREFIKPFKLENN